MLVIKIRLEVEKIYLFFIFTVLLFIGYGNISEHKLSHDFPYGYLASDAFQHQTRAQAIKDAGNFRYDPNYIAQSFDKVIGRYPPILYHLAVILSYASGLEIYDSIYFLVFLFSCFAVLVFYLIIRDFNKSIAILSLPLSLLIYSKSSIIGFVWGHWPSLLGQFFLITLFWGFLRFDLKNSYIFIGILSTALILTHTANLVFFLFFILLFFIARIFFKEFKWNSIKKMLYVGLITLIFTIHYFIIFRYSWYITQPYQFAIEPRWSDPALYIFDFELVALFIFIGLVFSIIAFKKKPHVAILASFSMLLLGFANYIGFGFRAFQIRFLWPLYLSFFFGFAIYQIIRFFIKNLNVTYSALIALSCIFLFFGAMKIPFILQYEKFSSQGLMDKYHWEAFKWISDKTEKNAKIYFFYGDIYSQDALLRNSKRIHYQVDPEDFVKSLNERKVKRYYVSELPGDGGGGLIYRKGLLSFGNYALENKSEYFFGSKDICQFNYFVFDKGSSQKVLAEYNLLIASQLLNKSSRVAFQNDLILILKNSKIGDDCIEERSF